MEQIFHKLETYNENLAKKESNLAFLYDERVELIQKINKYFIKIVFSK